MGEESERQEDLKPRRSEKGGWGEAAAPHKPPFDLLAF
jgi:hypothetical protein